MKQLASGLLLVTGPFKLNGCPLRRINQNYVIATSTKVDISSVKVPENLNDSFFNRVRAARKQAKSAEAGAEIFQQKKEEYKVTEERKTAQLDVDKQLLNAIRTSPSADRKLLVPYLKSRFSLSNKQYPHQMKF